MAIQAERGYLIWAVGDQYVDCARACAKSIKYHTPDANIALLSDKTCDDQVFDFNVKLDTIPMCQNPYLYETQLYRKSPFRETIKIEADMMLPASIDHWWTMLRHRDVVLTLGARDYYGEKTNCKTYRRIFVENDLPDVYNAITYWRVSRTAQDFFQLVEYLFHRWDLIQPQLTLGLSDPGTTDVVYAVAAKLLGVENFTLPNTSYPTLVHMRGRINNLVQEDWTKELTYEMQQGELRINTIAQVYPVHYIKKEFAQVLNEHYG